MGSNMAEQHPVGFQWVVEAKERGAKVIHVDPRFTRTSAMADLHVPIRPGTDIAFLGGLANYILQNERWFREYVRHYTNAPVILKSDFRDTEDASGFFSGWNPEDRAYSIDTWGYNKSPGETAAGKTEQQADVSGEQAHGAHGMNLRRGRPPDTDDSMEDERCVQQVLRRHFAAYTSEMVEDLCGCPREKFLRVAEWMCDNSGPERTSAICYAVGWTQHTTGVQNIRAAAVLQLLLGNVGRPGGGILALRGHATIQGSTDIATLYNLHPGYLNTPSALRPHDTLGDYISAETSATSYWSNMPKFIVSQLKAWYGDDATKENDYAYDYLPKIVGDHSHMPMFVDMHKGDIKGFFAMGQNPAVGGQNASFQREALAKLDWMVVRDLYGTETASFWKDSPEVHRGELRMEDIKTE